MRISDKITIVRFSFLEIENPVIADAHFQDITIQRGSIPSIRTELQDSHKQLARIVIKIDIDYVLRVETLVH